MLRIKFDIAYFVATQRLAFTKYPALCQGGRGLPRTYSVPKIAFGQLRTSHQVPEARSSKITVLEQLGLLGTSQQVPQAKPSKIPVLTVPIYAWTTWDIPGNPRS